MLLLNQLYNARHAGGIDDVESERLSLTAVPSNFRDLNLQAFEKGYDYGVQSLAEKSHSQEFEHVTYAEE